MARAETIEGVGEPGRGSSPLLRHNGCRMELHRSFHTWPCLCSGTATGAIHLYHNNHRPHVQGLCVLHSLPYPHPDGQDELHTHQQPPAFSPAQMPPSSPLCSRREDRGGNAVAPSALSQERSGSEREQHQDAFSRQGPLPDLLPRSEHPPWPSPHHRAPRGEALPELDVRRVATQLRAIGDEFNGSVLRRAHAEPHWQDWRDVCRGLFNFITQTLSTLYRLT